MSVLSYKLSIAKLNYDFHTEKYLFKFYMVRNICGICI